MSRVQTFPRLLQSTLRSTRAPARPIASARRAASSTASSSSRAYIRPGAAVALAAALAYSYAYTRPLLADSQKSIHSTEQASGQKLIDYKEVEKHRSKDDCWVIIGGNVYDVTDFLEQHPGGEGVILANAGKDATKLYQSLHPPDALDILPESARLGPVDPLSMPEPTETGPTDDEKRIAEARKSLPSADALQLVDDFEFWAEKVISGTGWAYYKSAADREISAEENKNAFRRYYFRPRVLRDVTTGSTATSFLGIDTPIPVFISPAAQAKLGHPLGEINLTKGAGECGIVQGISINASCSLDEIMQARKEGQKVIFQIYLNKDRSASEKLLKKVTDLGASAIFFTVDAAYRSKRTLDVRAKTDMTPAVQQSGAAPGKKSKAPLGVSQAISGYQDTNLTWGDIEFIRKNTHLPIIVKGVQSVEDIAMCAEKGVEGVVISNHGGRQCDFAPAPIDILYEMRINRPELFDKITVLIDGGVRSGADVVKCVALGAKAVGLGRPFLYANGTHGQEGVERVCEILQGEIENTMRNIGARTIDELKPEMVGPAGPWVRENRPPYVK